MDADDPIEKGKAAIVGELIQEVAESPKIREAGGELGQAVLTISKAINVCLLPLAAINFGYEKARQYYAEKFQQDLAEKTANILPEDIVEPKVSVVGPALQGLAFSHEEQDLKEMYLNLIAMAMNRHTATNAHPAYVEVIKQMTAREADQLGYILKSNVFPLCCVRLRLQKPAGWRTLQEHIINLIETDTNKAVEDADYAVYVDNWVRLGLISIDYDSRLVADNTYDWIDTRPEVVRLRSATYQEGATVHVICGMLHRTSFGNSFAKAVGIIR